MMLLQIHFDVDPSNTAAFEAHYAEAYVPAMKKQQGYLGSKLLRVFAPALSAEIEAVPTEYNYQMDLLFDSEEDRRLWVASDEHQVVWPRAEGLARRVGWNGYDVVGVD